MQWVEIINSVPQSQAPWKKHSVALSEDTVHCLPYQSERGRSSGDLARGVGLDDQDSVVEVVDEVILEKRVHGKKGNVG